jgi:hypothetical protein
MQYYLIKYRSLNNNILVNQSLVVFSDPLRSLLFEPLIYLYYYSIRYNTLKLQL